MKRRNGHQWLQESYNELLNWEQTWTRHWNRPWGCLEIPRKGIELKSTLVLPLRTGLRGPQPYLRATPALITVSDDFPQGDPIIAWEDSHSQGAFSQFLENVSIDCRGIANGPVLAGDQESYYRGVLVERARDFGVWARTISHGTCLERISIEFEKGNVNATGLKIGGGGKSCTASVILGLSVNWGGVGIHRIDCGNVDDLGTSFEHTVLPYLTEKSASCNSRCHTMLANGPEGVLARITGSSFIEIGGTVRKSAVPNLVVNRDGELVPVSTQANKNDPKGFQFPRSFISR